MSFLIRLHWLKFVAGPRATAFIEAQFPSWRQSFLYRFSKVAAPRRVVEAFLSPQGGSYSAFCFEDGGAAAAQTRKIAPAPFPAQWKAGLRSEKLIERPFVKHAVLVRFLTKGIVVLMRCVPHFKRKRSLVPLERRRGMRRCLAVREFVKLENQF